MRDIFVSIYLFLLLYIAVYGVHLFWIIGLYSRNRKRQLPTSRLPETLPTVTVQLPVFNERLVAQRLIRAVADLAWPTKKLQIQVLDDSDDATTRQVAAVVSELRADCIRIDHIRRGNRRGFKAGALDHGLCTAIGEFIAVFDADNLPRPDFLKRTIAQFVDPSVGMVQARWSFLNRDESLLCRAQALFLDAHFYVEQAARFRGGLFLNFNGTAGVWRRAAIDSSGGWQSDTLTEDLDLSYRAQLNGWRLVYLEDVDVPTELPASIRSFKAQQFRWTKGAIETARKVLPAVWRADLPVRIKLASTMHLTQKSVSLALLLLSVLLVPALFYRMEGGVWKLLLIDMPIFVLGTGSMSVFYSLAYKRERQVGTSFSNLILPVLTSIGIALSVNNSIALLSAFTKRHKAFVRTPKSGTTGRRRLAIPREYVIPFDHSVRAEMFFAGYSLAAIGLALATGLYPTVPYLLTFCAGFTFFAYLSVKERYGTNK